MVSHKNVFKLLILLLLSLACFSGCARTVETQSNILEMHVHLEFRGPVDTSQFRYLLIFSPSQAPVLPAATPPYYFPTPGRSFDEVTASQNGGIQSYYQRFYSTWSDYIVISPAATVLYPSKSTAFSSTTTNNASYQTASGFSATTLIGTTTIDCRFFVQALSPSSPTKLFFKFATSLINDGTQSGLLQDYNDDDASSILVKSGQKVGPFTHASAGTPPQAASLTSWYVEIL